MRASASVSSEGFLRIYQSPRLAAYLDKRKGQRLEVELLDQEALRSDRANRYWWGVAVPFVQQVWQQKTGAALPLPKEAVHDALVATFGGGLVDTPLGPARKSSAKLSVREFSVLIDAVRDYAWQRYQARMPAPEEWTV